MVGRSVRRKANVQQILSVPRADVGWHPLMYHTLAWPGCRGDDTLGTRVDVE